MSEDMDADAILDNIINRDNRYSRQAYCFLMDALKHTTGSLPVRRHVTGQELSMGIRDYAIEQFGIAVPLIFEQWGISSTRDFGEMVFNMVNAGLMRKTDEDDISDFEDAYDFKTEFDTNFKITVDKSNLPK
ncbi:MAG: Minf_1886 family protein [Gemmatimonadota bacterium]|nr:Minf_1886 family protein [Gemmatimonadota bacterium]